MTLGSSELDPDPSALESMRRMAYDRSKWLQSRTYEITKYEYNKEELNQFYDELRDVIERVKSQFICQLCKTSPKKCVVIPCGHFFCLRCSTRWFKSKKRSNCPECQQECEEKVIIPFYAMDSIISDMSLFLKEAKHFQNSSTINKSLDPKAAAKRLKSMNFVLLQRLKNIESQLMCDFCFNKINQTCLVECSSSTPTRRAFCQGCEKKYIKFYEKEQGRILNEPMRFIFFDTIIFEFFEFLNKVVDYSKSSKNPTRFTTPHISLFPVYKLLAGFILIGIILLYYSS